MHACLARTITVQPERPFERKTFTMPILAAICWVSVQMGCVWNPDISPAHALVNNGTAVTESIPATSEQNGGIRPHNLPIQNDRVYPEAGQESTSQSLRHASSLLRQAATMLDNNDRAAIRLILQAITILKQEIMRGADSLEYDRVSSSPFSSEREESWQDARALLSLLHHEIARYEPTLQLNRQLTTGPPLPRDTDRSATRHDR